MESFRITMLSTPRPPASPSIAAPLAPTSISPENEIIQMQHPHGHGHGFGHIFIGTVATMAAITATGIAITVVITTAGMAAVTTDDQEPADKSRPALSPLLIGSGKQS